jgi:hypothetical protein
LARLRSWLPGQTAQIVLSLALVLHTGLLTVTSTRNVWGKMNHIVDRYGHAVPASSLTAARAAVNPACRTSVFFQAMRGFGDLPYLQYPHPTQAAWARFIVVSKRTESNLLHNRLQREFVNGMSGELKLRYEDEFLAVYERPAIDCVKKTTAVGD